MSKKKRHGIKRGVCPTCGGPVRQCQKCGEVEHEGPQRIVTEPWYIPSIWPWYGPVIKPYEITWETKTFSPSNNVTYVDTTSIAQADPICIYSATG